MFEKEMACIKRSVETIIGSPAESCPDESFVIACLAWVNRGDIDQDCRSEKLQLLQRALLELQSLPGLSESGLHPGDRRLLFRLTVFQVLKESLVGFTGLSAQVLNKFSENERYFSGLFGFCQNFFDSTPEVASKRKFRKISKKDQRHALWMDLGKGRLNLFNPSHLEKINVYIKQHDIPALLELQEKLHKLETPPSVIDGLKSKIEDALNSDALITDCYLLPRSEFRSRYFGSSAFLMRERRHWRTYHRSRDARFYSLVGGRSNAHILDAESIIPFSTFAASAAHVGAYKNPASLPSYAKKLEQHTSATKGYANLRDMLLWYRYRMAKTVEETFSSLTSNSQPIKIKERRAGSREISRPIVCVENKYPCVLVFLSALNPGVDDNAESRYWSEKPEMFQLVLISSFVAYMNRAAEKENIPIEMVLRSSFGHNLPSVSDVGKGFRISPGLVPLSYAKLIAKVLVEFGQVIKSAFSVEGPPVVDSQMYSDVCMYNAIKLKEKIDSYPIYSDLRKSDAYRVIAAGGKSLSVKFQSAFNSLWSGFRQISNRHSGKKGKGRISRVELKPGMKIWEAIRCSGDSAGKSVLAECFRENGSVDWFCDQVALALKNKDDYPIITALCHLVSLLVYRSGKVKRKRITFSLNRASFLSSSFKEIYKTDSVFSNIVDLLFKALTGKSGQAPNYALYSELDRMGVLFFQQKRGKQEADYEDEPDNGSDSECEVDYTFYGKMERLYHVKIRVCSGMRAILMIHHGVLRYIEKEGFRHYTQCITNMYFEVSEKTLSCLKVAKRLTLKPLELNKGVDLYYFDLNENNAENKEQVEADLSDKLIQYSPAFLILDYTSSPLSDAVDALKSAFRQESVKSVILVSSGLKNDQAGLDFNPYGEIRIFCRSEPMKEALYNCILSGLSEDDKLWSQSHQMVRACKLRGLAPSFEGLFRGDSRYKPIPHDFESQLLRKPSSNS